VAEARLTEAEVVEAGVVEAGVAGREPGIQRQKIPKCRQPSWTPAA
jgi:hypothetical protein